MKVTFDTRNAAEVREVMQLLGMAKKVRGIRRNRTGKNWMSRWTKEEDKFLVDHAGRWQKESISNHLQRTPDSVEQRAFKLGISLRKRPKVRAVA
jgi:hypothetical protein